MHIADDAASFAKELRGLLARRDEVVQVIAHSPALLEPYAWERQATARRTLYARLLGSPHSVTEPAPAAPRVHNEIANHPGREEIVFEARILNACERGGNCGVEGGGQDCRW